MGLSIQRPDGAVIAVPQSVESHGGPAIEGYVAEHPASAKLIESEDVEGALEYFAARGAEVIAERESAGGVK